MSEPIEAKVQQQIQRLTTHSLHQIEKEVAQKRLAWLNSKGMRPNPCMSPRQAFELLFFEYMGLGTEDLPIHSECADEISWYSQNPCPTLTACQRLGLDTRKVCRAAYEKSTQAFVSFLNPQLRFLRSYQEIRPYAEYCLERIVRLDFEALMHIALKEAQLSRSEGNKGYGALVVLGKEILARAHDTATCTGDPSQHAEVNAIRRAIQTLGDSNLSGAVLVSTCEPCPMCSSLAVWANLSAIVYGASIEETARLGKARIMIPAGEVIAHSPVSVEVFGGVLQEECLALYRE